MAAPFESTYMISNTAVIYPPSRTQCRPVCGRAEGSQSQVTPDTPWPSGLAFPRPPVFEGHQILQSDAHWRRLKGDLSCLDVCAQRDDGTRTGREWTDMVYIEGYDTKLWHTRNYIVLFLQQICADFRLCQGWFLQWFPRFLGDWCNLSDFSQWHMRFSSVETFI